jgi:hypothetical protein
LPLTATRSRLHSSSAKPSRSGSKWTSFSETSVSRPPTACRGEERPARIRVDTSLDWPTWSQTAYRSWAIGEEPEELPEVLVEVAFRVQRLDSVPPVQPLLEVLPEHLDVVGHERLVRLAATIEQLMTNDNDVAETAVEVSYEGSCQLDESILEDPTTLDDALAPLGREVASVLVRIADLPFSFRPLESPPA